MELENKYLGQCILTQISVKKGIKKLGSEAVEAVINEWKQMNEKNTFVPILASELSKEDKVRALRMIMFIKRKRCGRIKARGCADGRKQRNYIPKEDASSPIVSTEGLMISYVLDAKENFKVLQYYLRKANSNKNSLPDPSINTTIHDTNIPITIDNFSSKKNYFSLFHTVASRTIPVKIISPKQPSTNNVKTLAAYKTVTDDST